MLSYYTFLISSRVPTKNMNNTYGVSLKENIFNYFILFFRNFVSEIAKNAAKIGDSLFRILFDKTTLPK